MIAVANITNRQPRQRTLLLASVNHQDVGRVTRQSLSAAKHCRQVRMLSSHGCTAAWALILAVGMSSGVHGNNQYPGWTMVADYQQCGGKTGCNPGQGNSCPDSSWMRYACSNPNAVCERINEWHWQCNPNPKSNGGSTPVPPSPTAPPVASRPWAPGTSAVEQVESARSSARAPMLLSQATPVEADTRAYAR